MRASYRLSQLSSCRSSGRPGNHSPHIPRPRRSRPATLRLPETPAETLPPTNALYMWAADTVPRLLRDRERDKFLCYAWAHALTNVDWAEALKLWWLKAHAQAVRRGRLQLPDTPKPTPAPEPPPFYDVELHAQLQADIMFM